MQEKITKFYSNLIFFNLEINKLSDSKIKTILKDKKFVDITGKTIGKGFAGVMKRHNFSGLRASHGVSISHRSHGSTGNSQDPGRVFKGKKMSGHMGASKVTVRNLEVVVADVDKGVIFLKGAVPGHRNSLVSINKVSSYNGGSK